MFGRVSSSAVDHLDTSFKPQVPLNLTTTDEEESDEDAEAAAIAEALLGRKPLPTPPNGRNPVCKDTKQGGLEEGQVSEDQVCPHRLNTSSQDVSSNSVGQPLVTSLLDRLGPPSQSAPLASVSSSSRRNHPEQADSHLPSTEVASLQSQDGKTLRLLPDDQKSSGELRATRVQKRPHSPRRRRNSLRSRSPVRSRHSPPLGEGSRRASLSARITLNNGRNSCSPDSMQLDLPPRPKRIARRFSSPSNSAQYRRDPRDREIPNSSRYHSNVSSDPRRSRHHPDLCPPCEPVVEEPNSISISNAGSTIKSPSRNILDTPSTAPPKPPKVSIRVENLPSYYILTPKRLYEHFTDPIYRHRSQLDMPSELKLYRYARSDFVVAELKFDSLEHARYFTQKVDRAWPPFWYSSKQLPPHSRQKNVEFTILQDKHASWPSNYETYFPKIRSGSNCSSVHVAEVDVVALDQPTDQVAKPSHIVSSVDPSAASTSKVAKDAAASPAKIKPKPDYYRPKLHRPSQDATLVANERKNPSLSPPHPDKCNPVTHAIPIPVDCLGSPSSQGPKDIHTSSSKAQSDGDGADVKEKQTSSTSAIAPTEEHHQLIYEAPTLVNISAPVTKSASDADVQPMQDLHVASQNIADSADSELAKPLLTAEKNEDTRCSVMLSKLHPSLTWPVLQSHFSFPNRPRHFRIFQPFQVVYGSFFPADRSKAVADDSAGSQEGCMISLNDANTAKNFCRVLQQNPPFQSVQIQLVDPADIEFVPSASIIRKPHDEDYAESAAAIDPANQFIQNSLLDFQNQLNWSPVIHSEMQSPAPTQMEINPLIPISESPFTDSDFTMQSNLGCSVYPFSYSNGYQSSMLGYPQSCSSVPMNYPYNPPSHRAQTFAAPLVSPEGFSMTPNDTLEHTPLTSHDTPEKTSDTQQERQDRLKKILQERMAKSRR